MHKTDRRALLMAILLGALAVLALSACGVADNQAQAATGAHGAPSATAIDATALPDATEDSNATAQASIDATVIPGRPEGTAVPGTATDPTASAIPTAGEPTTTATPITIGDSDPFTGTDDLTDTDDLTGTTTLTITHPVAVAIGEYFGVSTGEVFALHQEGLGF